MNNGNLTSDDVARLVNDPSGDNRTEAAGKIASQFASGVLNEAERTLAEEIFRMMVKDAEIRVRSALAVNLKDSSVVPHDVALSLATDVDQVALPIIQYSDVLTDDDLMAIIHAQSDGAEMRQMAVAQREGLSENLSEALVDSGSDKVVETLVNNESANISERTFQKVISNHGASESIQAAMVDRSKLPLAISERLVTIISDHLKDRLVEKNELTEDMATDLILQSRERATILLSENSSQDELLRMIRGMNKHGRLTPSIVLRALCMGDTTFYEAAMAELANVELLNARTLIYDSGELGLPGIFKKAGLPASHFPAHKASLDVSKEMEYDGNAYDRERYSRRMIERILTQYGDLGVDFDSNDLNYLLAKMDSLPSHVAMPMLKPEEED